MKKIFLLILASKLAIFVEACNQKTESVDGSKLDGLTLEELFLKSDEAAKKLKSMAVDVNTKQKLSYPSYTRTYNYEYGSQYRCDKPPIGYAPSYDYLS